LGSDGGAEDVSGRPPGPRPARRDLLLAAADWQSRALTLAELEEAGYVVMAVPGLRYALKAIVTGLVDPPLVLLDVAGDDEATPERAGELLELLPAVPLIVVCGAYERAGWEPLRPRLAALLQRPVFVGDVIAAVRRHLPPADQQTARGP
jgi:DNA-binding NtrC family response regulator